jgi:hypothetical protein
VGHGLTIDSGLVFLFSDKYGIWGSCRRRWVVAGGMIQLILYICNPAMKKKGVMSKKKGLVKKSPVFDPIP